MGWFSKKSSVEKYLTAEDRFTRQCANYLRVKNVLFHHTFNEAKRNHTDRYKYKAFGCMTGIPDFLIFSTNSRSFKGVAIELKVVYANGKKNVVSKNQKEAQKKMQKEGWKVLTVWNFEDFVDTVEKYCL